MFRYSYLPCRLLQKHSSCAHTLLNHASFSSAETETDGPKKCYDLTKYEFPYDPIEMKKILDILNHSSEEDFLCYKITKGYAKKLIKGRNKVGRFKNVRQVLDIDGFGIKKVESICNKVLKEFQPEDNTDDENLSKNVIYKKRLVKPKVTEELKKSLQTFLSVDFMISSLSWTLLDRHGTVLDVGSEELLTKDKQLQVPEFYDKMLPIVSSLPEADIYVWEERANYGYLQRATLGSIIIALKSAQLRGIMIALLESRNVFQESRHLFYVRDAVVSRLFQLKVGNERISGLQLADNLMNCDKVLNWLPPLTLAEGMQEKYLSLDKNQRKLISIPLFVGLAFYEAVLQDNRQAVALL